MTKLHVFDMDGTLLEGSATLHISAHVGKLGEVSLIEERWIRGEVGHHEFWEECLPLWGPIDARDAEAVFEKSPWKKNVSRVFADIGARGEYSAVITLSPQFFVDRLLGWGATSVHGAGIGAGAPFSRELVLTPQSKVEITRGLLDEYGVQARDCVAYGDSSSDVPLFEFLSNTVAVNAADFLRALAALNYEGDDMWEAYLLGRSLIDRGRAPP